MPTTDGPLNDLGRLIEVLDRHQVEYLMVGGIAAIAYGAERPTEDVDCVVRRERANLERLAGALLELHARLRVGGMTDAEARALPVQIDATALERGRFETRESCVGTERVSDDGRPSRLPRAGRPDGPSVEPRDEFRTRGPRLDRATEVVLKRSRTIAPEPWCPPPGREGPSRGL